MSWGTYLLVFLVMTAGSTVQSSVGIGQGLLSAPLLRLLHPALLPGPIVLAGFLTSIVLAWRNSHRSDIREVVPAIIGRVFGSGLAIALLLALDERGLTLTIGAIVLALVLLRLSGLKIDRNPRTLAGTGVASGVGGTIAAMGGAPMGLLLEQHSRARDFRGPIGVCQVAGGFLGVLFLNLSGEMDGEDWLMGLTLFPPIALGWIFARWVTPIVDRGFLGPAVLMMSAGSALVLIVSELV